MREELINYIKKLLADDNSYVRLSNQWINNLVDLCLSIPDENDYTPPFRHGRSNSLAILDSNGIEVAQFSKRNNGNSKSKLFLKLLEFRFDT